MGGDIRERVEALRREIAHIQRLNLEYLQKPSPHPLAAIDHVKTPAETEGDHARVKVDD